MLLVAPTQEYAQQNAEPPFPREVQLTRTVLPTKILKPTQAGNKRFVNVNGCATRRV
jgi:hypothetical protein